MQSRHATTENTGRVGWWLQRLSTALSITEPQGGLCLCACAHVCEYEILSHQAQQQYRLPTVNFQEKGIHVSSMAATDGHVAAVARLKCFM